MNEQIADIDAEISGYDEDIRKLRELRALRMIDKKKLVDELQGMLSGGRMSQTVATGGGKTTQAGIDYDVDGFDWSQQLKSRMKTIFGINNYRLCQQG